MIERPNPMGECNVRRAALQRSDPVAERRGSGAFRGGDRGEDVASRQNAHQADAGAKPSQQIRVPSSALGKQPSKKGTSTAIADIHVEDEKRRSCYSGSSRSAQESPWSLLADRVSPR
jgi:hypothetical protein